MCQGDIERSKVVRSDIGKAYFFGEISRKSKYINGRVKILKKKDGNLTVKEFSPIIGINGTIR